ncbi:MAG: hydrogenase formation protein HypD [Bacteroidales bacterium]|nr:hydrogenase formation protein HypD [Bacteroidales bacterium]
MKYIDEYRNKELIQKLANKISNLTNQEITLMEVCGGHTWSSQKFGLPSLLPSNIRLISGPGCPVCVTSKKFIDYAIKLSNLPNTIITLFGDLIKVPGSFSSLYYERSKGNDVRIVYSITDAINIAELNPSKQIIFLAIGFETTAPSTAAAILTATQKKLRNFFILSSHKIMPPAMAALIDEGIKINGYIAPGHVSTITGSYIYENLVKKYRVGCVISGFEPLDMLQSIYMLIQQIINNDFKVEIQYRRAVKPEGNMKAKELMCKVFTLRDDWWRGLGVIPNSGLRLNDEYSCFDAEKVFNIMVEEVDEDPACICGQILKGLKTPNDCKLFAKTCTPDNPVGACMVSHEGACNIYYRLNKYE